jgi:hypothetical protein
VIGLNGHVSKLQQSAERGFTRTHGTNVLLYCQCKSPSSAQVQPTGFGSELLSTHFPKTIALILLVPQSNDHTKG